MWVVFLLLPLAAVLVLAGVLVLLVLVGVLARSRRRAVYWGAEPLPPRQKVGLPTEFYVGSPKLSEFTVNPELAKRLFVAKPPEVGQCLRPSRPLINPDWDLAGRMFIPFWKGEDSD